ncbi:hypothetical protein ABZS61_32125 [Streptomyces sp. NPDC005566]|uniref:hypothetical protein n=1 Tax=Streptomyces sp. NPDC005566 TaxID=3156886 RepID=UPI0033B764E5
MIFTFGTSAIVSAVALAACRIALHEAIDYGVTKNNFDEKKSLHKAGGPKRRGSVRKDSRSWPGTPATTTRGTITRLAAISTSTAAVKASSLDTARTACTRKSIGYPLLHNEKQAGLRRSSQNGNPARSVPDS